MTERRLISTGPLSTLLGLDTKTVKKYANEGLLPSERTLKGHHRFDPRKVRDAYRERGYKVPKRLIAYINGKSLLLSTAALRLQRVTTRALLDELANRRANGDPLLLALDEEERRDRKKRAA